MSKQDEKILKAAAAQIRKYGWTRGEMGGKGLGTRILPSCIYGAILDQTTDRDAVSRCFNIASFVVGESARAWNDREASGKKEVLEVLKVAAFIAKDL